MDQLEKTQHVNLLMDMYGELLTDKQRNYLNLYYDEDLSLAEIAEELDVSRNAVYDNLKRAIHTLEDYEAKLKLLEKHEKRLKLIDQLEAFESQDHEQLYNYLEQIKNI